MRYERKTGMMTAMAIVALHLLMPGAGCVAFRPLDRLRERVRNDPGGTLPQQRKFVKNCREYVAWGEDPAEVVNLLAWIAKNPRFRSGDEAVRALAYIADDLDEAQFQEALLRIVVSDVRPLGSRGEAAKFLKLKASESIRTRILEFVKSRSCSAEAMEAGLILLFQGDLGYLQFVEEWVEARADQQEGRGASSLCYGTFLYQLRHMRLAREPLPDILAAIASSDPTLSREYLLRRAALGGADLKPYAAAVVEFLSLPKELTKHAYKTTVIQIGHEMGLFSPEQVKRFPLPDPIVIAGQSDSVPWATEYQAKWLREHRFKKNDEVED